MPDSYRNPKRISLIVVFLFVLVIPIHIVFCAEPVETDNGPVQGTVEEGLRIYRGIPYAAPPVGNLRWKAPEPARGWQGILPADKFGPASMQNNPAIANLSPPGENCLYFNVWTPAKNEKEKLPVMVWIHGGGFVAGTPSEQLYQCEHPAEKGVVMVSIGLYDKAQAGPVVHLEGLKTFDEYFKWRRESE